MRLGGFWAGGGLGGASTGVNCQLCGGDRREGFSGFLSAGLSLSPKLPLGAEANAWFDGTDDVNQRLALYGADRFVDINANRISSPDGPEVWYTDAYGQNGQTEPFPNSIRQWIARGESAAGVDDGGPTVGDDRDYSGPGTQAPN